MNKRNQQNRYSNQLATNDGFEDFNRIRERMLSNFGFGMNDPFDHDFFGGKMKSRFDDFMFKDFDFDRENSGNFVSQSYSTTTTIGADGKPVTTKKIRNKVQTIDNKGNKIIEDSEFYKNSEKGVKRYQKQKTLGDKTVKFKRE